MNKTVSHTSSLGDSFKGNKGSDYHVPVLFTEAICALNIKPGGIYVDCTFGGGGHSRGILSYLDENGRLIAFDQDADAQKNVPEDDRVLFIAQNFRHLQRFLRLHQIGKVDGVLADLGVSSHQFDVGERGFSTRFQGPLDMRMDRRQNVTAATVLAGSTESELVDIFSSYGEVSNSKTLAKHIVTHRNESVLSGVESFKNMIAPVVRGNPNKYLAQVFQALRIRVNDELGALKSMLEQLPDILNGGGRVAIITFHSLEDRLVKNFFRTGTLETIAENPFFNTKTENPFKLISKKPVLPSAEEMQRNGRSRSSKLRVAERK